MPQLDDRILLQLAVEPPRPLFPLLRQAGAMTALVALIAVLPALYACENRTGTEAGALWSLNGLQRLSAHDLSEFVDPGSVEPATPYKWQPPLMGVLTALCLGVCNPQNDFSPVISACLCTMGLLAVSYFFVRRAGGERLALLATLLLAINPEVLKLAQEPLPHALSQMFAAGCLWGVVAHWGDSTEIVSLRLLPAGLALGLCVLSGGLVAAGVVATLVLHVLWRHADGALGASSFGKAIDAPARLSKELGSLAVVVVTAFAACGWWELMMSSQYGSEFCRAWLSWTSPQTPAEPATFRPQGVLPIIEQFNDWVLPLFSLSVLGAIQILRSSYAAGPADGNTRRLFLAWMAGGLLSWMMADTWLAPNLLAQGAWQAPLVISLVLLAAVGLLEIEERKVPFSVSLLALLPACAQVPWAIVRICQQPVSEPAFVPDQMLVRATFVGLAVAAAGLGWFARGRLVRQQKLLLTLVLLVLVGSMAWGSCRVRRSTKDDRELAALRASLLKLSEVRSCTLIAAPVASPKPSPSPAPLQYLLRSSWSEAPFFQADAWNAAVARRLAQNLRQDADPGRDHSRQVVVIWGGKGQPNLPGGGLVLKPIAPLYYYRGFEVTAYEALTSP